MTDRKQKRARQAMFGAGAALAISMAAAAVASAQDQTGKHSVVRQLDASEVKARSYRVADLFGESDEDKAARLQREQAQDSAIAALQQHVDDLEATVRRLTGQIEQEDHKIADLNAKIDRMQKDFDYKLCTVTAQQLGESSGGDTSGGALPCGGQVQSSNGPAAPPPSRSAPPPAPPAQEPIHLAPPPGVLGTLPSNGASSASSPARADAAASPNKHKFDAAMNLLAKAEYDDARGAFRSFADSYPDDPLAPQAVYWLGDIAYVQKDYIAAAHAFAEEIKKYPDSPRGGESMLKLGQSLIAMDQKKEGCTALAALASKFPDSSKTVLTRASDARKAAGCRGAD
jgi:tol-pal system protein YbgF